MFDDGDNGQREQCGLPNLPGFVVTPKARAAGLQVQPLPNPVDQFAAGPLMAIDRISTNALQSTSVMTGDPADDDIVRDDTVQAVNDPRRQGRRPVACTTPLGEDNWSPFVTR